MLGKRCAGRLKAPPKKMEPAQLRARRDRGKFMICKNSGTLSCFLFFSLGAVVAQKLKNGAVCDERSGKKQGAIRG